MIAAAHLLALTMWGECRSGGETCMRAIGHVVVNRVSTHRDKDVAHAVWRRGQFACWHDKNRAAMRRVASLPADHPDARAWAVARKLAVRIVAHRDRDPTRGATHFATSRRPWPGMVRLATVGRTGFYREKVA